MARRAAGTTTRKGPEAVSPVRCAIYTRKSTEEGLDQAFNSLDAQREAAEAYIASQKHEGWVALPDRYDDGGFTGANTNRPALRRLLADIELGRIDVVVHLFHGTLAIFVPEPAHVVFAFLPPIAGRTGPSVADL